MLLDDDVVADGEAKPGPLSGGLGREELIEPELAAKKQRDKDRSKQAIPDVLCDQHFH